MCIKKALLIVLTVLFTSRTYAQQAVGSICVQPKIGLNLATLTNDETAKIRPAIVAGLDFGYMASEKFLLSFGAMYSQQGCKSEESGIKGTIKMDYINIPLLANYYVAKGFAFKIGVQPGFLINDKVKVSVNGVSSEVGLETSLQLAGFDADINSFDLAIPLGFSYEFNNVQLDARYNWGLIKTVSGKDIDPSRNSVFQFTVGYKIRM